MRDRIRHEFVDRHLELLELERQAEIDEAVELARSLPEEQLERRGVLLRRLVVADLEPGFGGRLMAVLEPSRGGRFPAHRFQPGDVVSLRATRGEGKSTAPDEVSGVVSAVRTERIMVALDDEDAELPSLVRLDRVASDVTFKRMVTAMRTLRFGGPGPARELRRFVFADEDREADAPGLPREPIWFDTSLDSSQRAAVAASIDATPIALIHGPPGTGKTTAVVELIRQAVQRGNRVLASAPSNVAVDNLVERLVATDLRIVRLGHPARVLESVREHTLDAQVDAATDPRIYRELKRELQLLRKQLANARDRPARNAARDALRRLRSEQRRLESAAIAGVMDGAQVVLCTLAGAADQLIAQREFELVVIDEAAQSIEAGCWIPLLRGRRAVLVGDHWQLPPTIVSREAEHRGLGDTLFHRLTSSPRGAARTQMLTVQYRMHETIMRWSSNSVYEGRLTAADAVRAHRLCDLPGVVESADTTVPMLLIDTAGCGFEETLGPDDASKSNDGEARIVVRHVRALLAAGVPADAIGVITPYNAQVQLLRETLAAAHEGLEIDTVDGFQGREKEAIVLSLVRSNDDGEVGFLADVRRLNVAVTRARRHVAIVGDSATLANDAFLSGLIAYVQERGEYRSAWEMTD